MRYVRPYAIMWIGEAIAHAVAVEREREREKKKKKRWTENEDVWFD
jgi:hypothetical protein